MQEWMMWLSGVLFAVIMAVMTFVVRKLNEIDDAIDRHARDDKRHTQNGVSQSVMGYITENVRLQLEAVGAKLLAQIERMNERLDEHIAWEREWRAQFDREHRRNQP